MNGAALRCEKFWPIVETKNDAWFELLGTQEKTGQVVEDEERSRTRWAHQTKGRGLYHRVHTWSRKAPATKNKAHCTAKAGSYSFVSATIIKKNGVEQKEFPLDKVEASFPGFSLSSPADYREAELEELRRTPLPIHYVSIWR